MRTVVGRMSLEPVPSRPLRGKGRAVSASGRLRQWRIEHGPSKPVARQAARGPRDRPRPALSRPRPGSRCGVNCPEGQFNITGCCSHSPHSQAELARCEQVRATPVMSCAPQRLRRGQPGTARRARIPMLVRSRLRRHRTGSWSGAASGAVMEVGPYPPTHPPPKGAPPVWLTSTRTATTERAGSTDWPA